MNPTIELLSVAVEETLEEYGSAEEIDTEITQLKSRMKEKAKNFKFEQAAELRDRIKSLEQLQLQFGGSENED